MSAASVNFALEEDFDQKMEDMKDYPAYLANASFMAARSSGGVTHMENGLEKGQLKIPLLVNGQRVLGVIDTLADWSFICPTLVECLKLQTTPTSGKIHFAEAGRSVDRLGQTELVTISAGKLVFETKLE